MKKNRWLAPCILLLGVVLVVGCSRPTPPGPAANSRTVAPTSTPAGEAPLSGSVANGVREVKVEAVKYAFKPDQIVVKKGEKVRLLVTATDVEHGLALPDFKIDAKLPPRQEQVIEFTPDKTGAFTFRCSVYCGSGHSDMKGTLVVKE
jgi:cytochrome c oxidase subunit II